MRIYVTGSIAFDYIMVFPGKFRDHILADKMHVLSVSFLVDSLTQLRGGTGANIAYSLALLGMNPVLVGSVGKDFADYHAWLKDAGVDLSGVKTIDDLHTASCFINTDLEDNQITAFYPGAMGHAAGISLREAWRGQGRPGDHRPERPDRHVQLRGRMHGGRHPLPVRPLDADSPPHRRTA